MRSIPREDGLPFTLHYLRVSLRISGSISDGNYRRFQPSSGKSFYSFLIYKSLRNLLDTVCELRSNKITTHQAVKQLSGPAQKGGCYGVGDLHAHHLIAIFSLLGVIDSSHCTEASFCTGNQTTLFCRRHHSLRHCSPNHSIRANATLNVQEV